MESLDIYYLFSLTDQFLLTLFALQFLTISLLFHKNPTAKIRVLNCLSIVDFCIQTPLSLI